MIPSMPTSPPLAPLEPPTPEPPPPRPRANGGGEAKRAAHKVARWLHVYASMLALLIVLFFGVTGLTLNHPDWGTGTTSATTTGTFPFAAETDGDVAWLPIAEYVRRTHDVKGTVKSFEVTDGKGSIEFTNPGYSATLLFDTATGEYQLTVDQQGLVAIMNDLHKGRDTAPGWSWVIDIAAVFLIVIALTGLVLQLFLKRRRRKALLTGAAGVLLVVVVAALTLT
jgi:hypothetical protein